MQFFDLILIVCIACGWDNDFGYWVSISLLALTALACVGFIVVGPSSKMAFIVGARNVNKYFLSLHFPKK
jgi:hypothetical protein